MSPPSELSSISPKKNVDFILVGQGLAGSILALSLLEKGKRILVIDKHLDGASSRVAAGIINPITGHRLNITEGMAHFLPSSIAFFECTNQENQPAYIHELPQQRLIKKQGQLDYWHKRKQQASHADFLGLLTTTSSHFRSTEFGIGDIKHTYQVDVNRFLDNCNQRLREQLSFYDDEFDYSALKINSALKTKNEADTYKVTYKEFNARKIIFCEGYRAIYNPWWQHLPFKLAKGELLEIESPYSDSGSDKVPGSERDKKLDNVLNKTPPLAHTMLNWGQWLLPKGKNNNERFLLGASYEWQTTDTQKSPDIADGLIRSFKEKLLFPTPNIVDHHVGIRPTTINRSPFIGAHLNTDAIYCFNGFGSKGCLTIPYYANKLVEHLCLGSALPKNVTEHL